MDIKVLNKNCTNKIYICPKPELFKRPQKYNNTAIKRTQICSFDVSLEGAGRILQKQL